MSFDFGGCLNFTGFRMCPTMPKTNGIWQRIHRTKHILFSIWNRFGPLSSYNQHFDIESKIIMRFVICTTWNSTPWGHDLLTLFTQKYDNYFWIFYNKTTTIGSEIETRFKVHSTNIICKMQQHKLFSRKNVLKFRPYCI